MNVDARDFVDALWRKGQVLIDRYWPSNVVTVDGYFWELPKETRDLINKEFNHLPCLLFVEFRDVIIPAIPQASETL